ncbi:hypothetical protein [Streptomyces sp. NBC_00105]
MCASRASWTPAAHTALAAPALRPAEPTGKTRPDDDIGWPRR